MTTTPPATAEQPPEVVTPEVVAGPGVEPPAPDTPSTAVAERDARDARLEELTDAAIAMPGIPGRDEFLSLALQARMLSLAGTTQKAVRESPFVALHVVMVGRDLGISPSAAEALIDVIPSQNGPRLSLSPQLLNGQIRRLGLGSIVPVIQTAERCVAAALGPHGEYDARCKPRYPEHVDDCRCRAVLGCTEFDWAEAQMAGLAGIECQPTAHSDKCGKSDAAERFKCKFGYKAYPKRMHWWRASGYAADDYFPEAGLGLYTAEELGAFVDEEGRPIDPSTVELPPGYSAPGGRGAGGAGDDGEKADADDLFDIQVRIAALPDEPRADLKAKWKQNGKLAGATSWWMTTSQARLVLAMLRGSETAAKKVDGWNADDARVAVLERIYAGLRAVGAVSDEMGSDGNDTPPSGSGSPAPQETPDPSPSATLSDEQVMVQAESGTAETIAARVAAMAVADVDAALADAYGKPTTGNERARRQRLILEMLRESLPS